MACGPQGRGGLSRHVNPKAILQAMQTAIARELRARSGVPQELPSELIALVERLKEQQK